MSPTLRLVKDADVRAILEQVKLTCACDVANLKADINKLVAVFAKPHLSPPQAIAAIREILRALEHVRNVLERYRREDLLLPNVTLDEALRHFFLSDLPQTARTPHFMLRLSGERTFGDQLVQLIDYYTALKGEWEALAEARGGRRQADTSRDFLVVGLAVLFQRSFNKRPSATRGGPFCRFLCEVLKRCGRPLDEDAAHALFLKVRKRKRSFLRT